MTTMRGRGGLIAPSSLTGHRLLWLVAITVLCGSIALAGGAPATATVRFALFFLTTIGLPGLAIAHLVRPASRYPAADLAVSLAAGYSLQIVGYTALGYVDRQDLIRFSPLLLAPLALLILALIARREVSNPPSIDRAWWLVAAPVAIAALIATEAYNHLAFPVPPEGFRYYQDLVFQQSLASELTRSVPPTTPWVAGLPLGYHYFVNAHFAAAHFVTGLELDLIIYRMYLPYMVVAAFLGIAAVGANLSERIALPRVAIGGVAASAMVWGANEFDPWLGDRYEFFGLIRRHLYLSPSFLLGLVLFIALVWLLLFERLRHTPGNWALVLLLMLGAAGAKVTVLPTALGAMGIAALIDALRTRSRGRLLRAVPWVVAGALVFAAASLTIYGGRGSSLRLAPFETLLRFPAASRAGTISTPLGTLVGGLSLGGLVAPWIGWYWIRERTAAIPLIAAGVLGLLGFVVLDHPGMSQLWVLEYGSTAALIGSAVGLVVAWQRVPRPDNAFAILLLAATLILVAQVLFHDFPTSYVIAGVAVVWVAMTRMRSTNRVMTPRQSIIALSLAAVMLGVGMDGPGDVLPSITRTVQGETRQLSGLSIDAGMVEGLRWIRDNSDRDQRLAVYPPAPRAFGYSAYSERRVYLESWEYTPQAHRLGEEYGRVQPFPDRFATNEQAFLSGDPESISQLRRAGVEFLVVDIRRASPDSTLVVQTYPVVFENGSIVVLSLRSG